MRSGLIELLCITAQRSAAQCSTVQYSTVNTDSDSETIVVATAIAIRDSDA